MATDENQRGETIVRRSIHDAKSVVVAHCRVDGLFSAWRDHVRTWNLAVDPLGEVMMRQALGGLALYLSCRLRDETFAFTFNAKEPPLNLFFSGDCDPGRVTGRYFMDDVRTAESNRLFVEIARRGARHTSVIDVRGLDILEVLEDYSRRSDQMPVRFFELGDAEYLMLASLPADDREWFFEMDRNLAESIRANARPLDARSFWFQCGCDPARMHATVRSLFEDRKDELFAGEDSITVACPRCGRNWRINAENF